MRYTLMTQVLVPSPPPTPAAADSGGGGSVVSTVFMVLLLPCVGMCIIFIIYLLLLWCSTRRRIERRLRFAEPVKPVIGKGLTVLELEKIPKVTGNEIAVMARSTECAVCLEDIESGQSARLVPGCNHGFHQLCADTWLSNHTVCPVCRAELAPKLPPISEDQSPC